MEIILKTIPSTNYSAKTTKKTGIVLHWIVGELSSADARFMKSGTKVSAHYGIGSSGNVHQYVQEKYIAYHAGVGSYNVSHIGIEHAGGQLEGASRKKPSLICHDTSAQLIADICKRHGIPCDRKHIIKHSEVKATQCCGTLDIDYIIQKANQIMGNQTAPFDYELFTVGPDIMLRILQGDFNGEYIVTRKNAGDRTGTTFDGTIYTSKSRADRKIVSKYDPIEYEVNVGGNIKTISFVPTPPAVDSKDQEISKLKAQTDELTKSLTAANKEISSLKTSADKLDKMHKQLLAINEQITKEIENLKTSNNELRMKNNSLNEKLKATNDVLSGYVKFEESFLYNLYKIFTKK